MAGVESRDFDSPDETRTPDKTQVDVVRMGGTAVDPLQMAGTTAPGQVLYQGTLTGILRITKVL